MSFDEHVRVSDHSHINIVRKVQRLLNLFCCRNFDWRSFLIATLQARVHANARLWDEPLTELKEQRVYKQQLADDANCEPVRITRSVRTTFTDSIVVENSTSDVS